MSPAVAFGPNVHLPAGVGHFQRAEDRFAVFFRGEIFVKRPPVDFDLAPGATRTRATALFRRPTPQVYVGFTAGPAGSTALAEDSALAGSDLTGSALGTSAFGAGSTGVSVSVAAVCSVSSAMLIRFHFKQKARGARPRGSLER